MNPFTLADIATVLSFVFAALSAVFLFCLVVIALLNARSPERDWIQIGVYGLISVWLVSLVALMTLLVGIRVP